MPNVPVPEGGGLSPAIKRVTFAGCDWVPNNQQHPVILYRGALTTEERDLSAAFEALFRRNGWPPQWRDGIYDFHHYHTEGHEVLGVSGGSARLLIGGPGGREVTVRAGDAVLLPAGTGHMKLCAQSGFLVVGAYPPGQSGDIIRQAPDEAQRARLLALPHPASDPVRGVPQPEG